MVELNFAGREALIQNGFNGLGTAEPMTADVELNQGELYSIELRYAHKFGPHKLLLKWESDTVDQQVIPSEFLYYQLFSETTPYTI